MRDRVAVDHSTPCTAAPGPAHADLLEVVDLPARGSPHRFSRVGSYRQDRPALGRVPSHKVYQVLFADKDRGPGGVKVASFGETILTAFTAP
jgi:hypothetical protein